MCDLQTSVCYLSTPARLQLLKSSKAVLCRSGTLCCRRRDALLGRGGPEDRPGGIAYTVSVPRQHNVTLVVSRAVQPGRASGLQHHEMVERLRASAAAVAATASFSFDAEPLVARDYMPL